MAENRFKAGRALLDALERLTNQLADHYGSHEAMQGTVIEEIPEELRQVFGRRNSQE
jgi:hypothetical protein